MTMRGTIHQIPGAAKPDSRARRERERREERYNRSDVRGTYVSASALADCVFFVLSFLFGLVCYILVSKYVL